MEDAPVEITPNDDLLNSANKFNQTLSTLSKFYISEVQDAYLLIAEHVLLFIRDKLTKCKHSKHSMIIWLQYLLIHAPCYNRYSLYKIETKIAKKNREKATIAQEMTKLSQKLENTKIHIKGIESKLASSKERLAVAIRTIKKPLIDKTKKALILQKKAKCVILLSILQIFISLIKGSLFEEDPSVIILPAISVRPSLYKRYISL